MKKCVELTFCRMVAAVACINNCIPHFPNATKGDKFTKAKIIELLKWYISQKWQNKFDLKCYTPSLEMKAKDL
jgi:hypothetical protein